MSKATLRLLLERLGGELAPGVRVCGERLLVRSSDRWEDGAVPTRSLLRRERMDHLSLDRSSIRPGGRYLSQNIGIFAESSARHGHSRLDMYSRFGNPAYQLRLTDVAGVSASRRDY